MEYAEARVRHARRYAMENNEMRDGGVKFVSEERISTVVGGKVVEGFRRVLQVGKSKLHQEVIYLGFSLGDVVTYPLADQLRMIDGAKRLLWEIANDKLQPGNYPYAGRRSL
jgi:hypothetical protein